MDLVGALPERLTEELLAVAQTSEPLGLKRKLAREQFKAVAASASLAPAENDPRQGVHRPWFRAILTPICGCHLQDYMM